MKHDPRSLRARGIAEVMDLVPMHDDPIRQAGAAIPPGNWAARDPFLSMMNDRFKKGAFGPHPHRGIETITYILEGSLRHQDSRGGQGVLTAGDAQWMTAGGGVEHLEDPVDDKSVHVLQLWLNLSAADKLTPSRYQDLRGAQMPIRKEPGAEVRVFSGDSAGIRGPALNHVPVTMVEVRLNAGVTMTQELPGSYNGFIYVIDGEGRFGRDSVVAGRDHTLWLERTASGMHTSVSMTAITSLRALLFAGEPLHESVVARGPFVMNTEQQIEEAYADYQAGRFGV